MISLGKMARIWIKNRNFAPEFRQYVLKNVSDGSEFR